MLSSRTPSHRHTVGAIKTTRASRVAEELRQSILSGDLAPGEKVSLDHLRKIYDVSLSPMREAISRLVTVGLVEFEEQRGYRIAPVSQRNLSEITKLRINLEGQALAECIEHADLDWESSVLSALHRLNQIDRNLKDPSSLKAWELAHSKFHSTLISGCDMPMLLTFCLTLHNLNDRYRRIFAGHNSGDRNVQDEHGAIAHAAIERNSDLAVKLLQNHIERTGASLLQNMGLNLGTDGKERR